jgi:hypothetical protein
VFARYAGSSVRRFRKVKLRRWTSRAKCSRFVGVPPHPRTRRDTGRMVTGGIVAPSSWAARMPDPCQIRTVWTPAA